jgi:hypothetical protein
MRICWLYQLLQILQRRSTFLFTLLTPSNRRGGRALSSDGRARGLARVTFKGGAFGAPLEASARPLSKSGKGSMLLANQTRWKN